jgi:hypothetical protein
MHQVRWLALVGLSLTFLLLVLVHFTFFGTLLVRFYRRKLIAPSKYTSIQGTHTFSNQTMTLKSIKQTCLEIKQSFKGS